MWRYKPPKVQRSLTLAPRRLLRICGVAGLSAIAVSLMADDPALQIAAPLFGLLTCVQLYPLLRQGELDIFEPPVLLGVFAAFATVSSVAAFADEGSLSLRFLEHLTDEQTLELVVKTILISILGLVFYYVGYYHPSWGARASRFFPDLSRPRWKEWRLHVAALGLLTVFTVTYYFFQGQLGVDLSDATQLAEGKAVWRDDPTTSWMMRGVESGLLAGVLYLAFYARERKWPQAIGAIGLLFLCSYLVSRMGQRGTYIAALQIAVGVYHYLVRRVPVWVIVIFILATTAVSNVQLQWRTAPDVARPDAREVIQGMARPTEALSAHEGERQRFATLALVFNEFPDRYDHLLGETYLGLVATFVPRWIWPEKGEHFQWRDTMIIPRLVGARIPSSYLAVLWVNWSYPGIVLGMLIWGVIHRALYEAMRRRMGDPGTTLAYLTTVASLSLTLHGVSSVLQFAVPSIACVLFIGGLRRPRTVESEAPALVASASPAALRR